MLYTNRNSLSDFVKNGITLHAEKVSNIYIAVAFFTNYEIVQEIAENCQIKMVVRLDFPTSPKALRELIKNNNVSIKYYTSKAFHPKLYIFGDQTALVGSANLTHAALQTNQEITVSIQSSDQRFDALKILFSDYWDDAKDLTDCDLRKYEKIYNDFDHTGSSFNKKVQDALGKVENKNISRPRKKTKKTKRSIFWDDYSKTLQQAQEYFNEIKDIYLQADRRKNKSVPIEIEIDSFISFVKVTYARGNEWQNQPQWGEESKILLKQHIQEWLEIEWGHFDLDICQVNYPLIKKVFENQNSFNEATYLDITNALSVVHSFHDRLRFFTGGLEGLVNDFNNKNKEKNVRQSLSHLVFDDGNPVSRMADLIYDPTFRLYGFGSSNVQELFGWVNNDGIPIINGRTTEILKYYGFDITVRN